MRRNPRPLRPVDRRRLAIEIIEREARAANARSMASEAAIDAAIRRYSHPLPTLTLTRK